MFCELWRFGNIWSSVEGEWNFWVPVKEALVGKNILMYNYISELEVESEVTLLVLLSKSTKKETVLQEEKGLTLHHVKIGVNPFYSRFCEKDFQNAGEYT